MELVEEIARILEDLGDQKAVWRSPHLDAARQTLASVEKVAIREDPRVTSMASADAWWADFEPRFRATRPELDEAALNALRGVFYFLWFH